VIVGVSGTTGGGTPAQRATLRVMLWKSRLTEVHHGEAIGVDEYAHRIVRESGSSALLIGHPPDDDSKRAFLEGYHEERDPAPYLIRDRQMVSEVQTLWAAPATDFEVLRSGTWATIRYARKARILVIRIALDGSLHLE
jgi:hypothetical protein